MTPEQYAAWAEARAEIPVHPCLPPVRDHQELTRAWPNGAFRCDSFGCAQVCCAGWPAGRGIKLNILDLLRLRDAGLLGSVQGAFRREPPDQPQLRSVDGHCVHYDPAARRCAVWQHRPDICRTYPFAVEYAVPSGRIGFAFAPRCSLTPAGCITPGGDAVRPTKILAIRSAEPTERAEHLSAYERSHLEACVDSLNEHDRTWRLVTEHPPLLEELGLGAYLGPDG